MDENPLENPTFEINLVEPFEERGLKGERNLIPYFLMNIDGDTLPFAALEPTSILCFNGVLQLERERREKDENFGFGNYEGLGYILSLGSLYRLLIT